MIKLTEVVYDIRARNGTWCKHQYQDHPNGCPNYPRCIVKFPDFASIKEKYQWYAIVEEFDLLRHMKIMKEKHPRWSERQCRNPYYWQGGVRKRLRERAEECKEWFCQGYSDVIILTIPEACGVNVFETMEKVGIILEKKPNTVRKVMLVGAGD